MVHKRLQPKPPILKPSEHCQTPIVTGSIDRNLSPRIEIYYNIIYCRILKNLGILFSQNS